MKLHVNLDKHGYDIVLERGILARAGAHCDLNRKVLIVTDAGVPKAYAQTILQQCKQGYIYRVVQGEGAKSFGVLETVLKQLLENGFSRKDCVVALGGGVVGDLAGFAAASYMRGIDFINIPTTTLAQIDSSIGGKVAVNLEQVKNVVGAFYQPRAVLIDPDTLDTLPPRHFYNGLVEALKAGLIGDARLFALFEEKEIAGNLIEIIHRANLVKKDVVEQDETEQGLRKILNFGHTIGHGIESVYGLGGLLHGECVGLGMLPMIEDDILRSRTADILSCMGIPTHVDYDPQKVYEVMTRDKKAAGDKITVVTVKTLGKATLSEVPMESMLAKLKEHE